MRPNDTSASGAFQLFTVKPGKAIFASVMAAALATACSSADEGSQADGEGGETFELTFGVHWTEDNPHSKAFRWYIDQVNERSVHTIELDEFYDGSLCAADEQLFCAQDGRTDFTLAISLFHPNELAHTSVAEIPFVAESPYAVAQAFATHYEENAGLRQEYEQLNLRPLVWSQPDQYFIGLSEPADSIDDLAGMDIRTIGYRTQTYEAVGVDPLAIPSAEVYESVQRGVAQGFVTDVNFAVGLQLQEVSDYWYATGTGHGVSTPIVMNEDAWAGLPEELQDTMVEVAAEYHETYWDEFLIPGLEDDCEKAVGDLEVVEPWDDAEMERFEQAARQVVEEAWLSNVEGIIEEPEEFLEAHGELVAQLEEETPEGRISGIEVCADAMASE